MKKLKSLSGLTYKNKFIISLFILINIFLISTGSAKAQNANVQDSLQLVTLYNNTTGSAWTNHTGWLTGPVGLWNGITLNTSGRVTIINLWKNNLTGSIPNLDLPNLQLLYLHENKLTGRIPNFNLPDLQSFIVLGNLLTDTIPNFHLPSLKYLNLYYNQLSGRIPNFDLPNLVGMNLGTNQLTDTIPNFHLPSLQSLLLYTNHLSGHIPNFDLPILQTINLSSNQLSGHIPYFDLTNLSSIDLSNNQLADTIPNFHNLNLIALELGGNLLTGRISDFDYPNLQYLGLGSSHLTDTIPNFHYPLLRELHLSGNQLSGKIPNFNFPVLTDLDLNFNLLTGNIPNFFFPVCDAIALDHNQLSGILPNFTIADTTILVINNNNFLFNVLEDLVQNHPRTDYSPQANIIIKPLADKLYVSVGGTLSKNTYKWYKNNLLDATIIGDSTYKLISLGTYRVEVSNSVATDLILKSDDYNYSGSLIVKLIDPNPSMIFDNNLPNGPDDSLVNDLSKIDYNKIVIGGATDGITKILLITESTVALKFSLQNPKDGVLKRLDKQSEFANEITVNPVLGKVVAIYEVPDGYGLSNSRGGRDIIVKVTVASNPTISKDVTIKLVTPPVVLVHGMWSDPSVWETEGKIPDATFVKALIKEKFEPPSLANYEKDNASTFDPGSSESIYGRNAVMFSIDIALNSFQFKRLAATQVDVVGHSLGGLMARSLSQQSEFVTKENYKKGYIHKLITLGTPHRGSPVGPEFYSHKDEWFKFSLFGAGSNLIPLWLIIKYFKPVGTCHKDFGIESSGIKNLKQTLPFYSYAIAGNYEAKSPFPEETYGYNVLDMAYRIVFDKPLDSIFKSRCGGGIVLKHDLCVPLESAKGYTVNQSDTVFFGTAHSGPANYTETNTPFLQAKVIRLLLSDDIFEFSPGFPAPYDAVASNNCETATQRVLENPISTSSRQQNPNGDQLIKISSPIRGSIYQNNSGASITLSIDVLGGAVPMDALFITKDLGWYPLPKTPPYSINFTLPPNAPLGKINILVLAKDTSGLLLADTSHIIFIPSGVLDSFVVDPSNIELDSSLRSQSIYVKGYYKNGASVTLSNLTDGSTGTNYSSKKNNTIFKVDSNGVVTAISPGVDTLVVTNGNKTIKVPVVVNNNFSLSKLYSNTIDFPVISNRTVGDNPFGLSASASSGDQVSFSLVSGAATVTNGIIGFTSPGQITVKASQAGNVYFAPAPDVLRTFCVSAVTPAITTGTSTTFCQGGSVTLTSNAASGNQWYKDGVAIGGSTGTNYIANASGSYTTKATVNSCVSVASNAIVVTVNAIPPKPTISRNVADMVSSAASGNQWFADGVLVAGATSSTFRPSASGQISVQVTVNGCTSLMSDNYYYLITAITDPTALENFIHVFPNPVTDKLNIVSNYTHPVQIQIFDILGRSYLELIKVSGARSLEINMSRFTAGTYLLVIKDSKTFKTFRKLLIKQY